MKITKKLPLGSFLLTKLRIYYKILNMNEELSKFNENQQKLEGLFSDVESIFSKLIDRLNDYNMFYKQAFELYNYVDEYLNFLYANADMVENFDEEYAIFRNLKEQLLVALNQIYSIRNPDAKEAITNFVKNFSYFKEGIKSAGMIFKFDEKQSFYSDIYSKILDTEKFYQETGDSQKAAKHIKKLSNAVNERDEMGEKDVEFDLTVKTSKLLKRYAKDFPSAETSEKYESANFNTETITATNEFFNVIFNRGGIQEFIENSNSELSLDDMVPLLNRIINAINDRDLESVARLTSQLELTSKIPEIAYMAGRLSIGFDKSFQMLRENMQGYMAENATKRFSELKKHVESLKNANIPNEVLQQHLDVLFTEMKEFENKEDYRNEIEQITSVLQQIQNGLKTGHTE